MIQWMRGKPGRSFTFLLFGFNYACFCGDGFKLYILLNYAFTSLSNPFLDSLYFMLFFPSIFSMLSILVCFLYPLSW